MRAGNRVRDGGGDVKNLGAQPAASALADGERASWRVSQILKEQLKNDQNQFFSLF